MKVLQLTTSSNWGAIGKIAEQISIEARKIGWDTYTAYSRFDVPCDSKLIKIGNKLYLIIDWIFVRLFDRAGLGMRLPTKKLIKEIKKINPDVIHIHNIHGYVINYPMLFSFLRDSKIPVVWTQHDFWAITGHCTHFVNIGCEKWKTGCNNCKLNKAYPKSLFDFSQRNYRLKRYYFNLLSNICFVGVSDWVSENLRQSFIKQHDIITIANGVDTSIFNPSYSTHIDEIPDNVFVIMGVASQWKKGKGLEYYIELSKIISKDEVIVLVGIKEDEKRMLPNNIIGLSQTNSQRELAALYCRADVVLSLSRAETFGMTIIESYACGTPVVVFNNTAQPLLIEDGVGFVARNGDVKDVYEKIKHIRNAEGVNFKQNCRVLAVSKYDKQICSKKYIDLYKYIISKTIS